MAEATVKDCKSGWKGEGGFQAGVSIDAICAVGTDVLRGAAAWDEREELFLISENVIAAK